MTNTMYGHYKDAGEAIDYEYDATWRAIGEGVTWNATVRATGADRIPAHPSGIVGASIVAAGDLSVRAAIMLAIERCTVACPCDAPRR